MPSQHDSQKRKPRKGPLRITVPSRNDPFLRSLVGAIGGPLGRRTEPGIVSPGFWRVERVLLVIVFIFGMLAVVSKSACRTHGWGMPNVYRGLCYSDWAALYGARGFAEDPWAPFTGGTGGGDAPFEYPVLMSFIASVTSLLVPRSENISLQTLSYFDINTFLVVVLWAVVVIAVAKSAGRRPWDAALVAASPAIVFAATVNWDMWAVAFLALGLLALGREHPWLAGVLIGLGAATKLYPVLVLGALLVLAIRTGRWSGFLKVTAGAAGSWLVVNLPFALAATERWWTFYTFSADRGAGNSSLWQAWDLTFGSWNPALHTTPGMISVLGTGLFALSCLGILILGLVAPRPPRVASLAFLVVAAFVLFGKVYSPQFILWLIPLAALALPRWRTMLVWQAIEIAHFIGIWLFLYARSGEEDITVAFPDGLFVLMVLGHMVALVWVSVLVVRTCLNPNTDPVRRVGMDDPLGGLFAGADRFPGGIFSTPATATPNARRSVAAGDEPRHPAPDVGHSTPQDGAAAAAPDSAKG
ncbi:MAG: glycosyltransferase family 87 protein [Galactobacter sp.]